MRTVAYQAKVPPGAVIWDAPFLDKDFTFLPQKFPPFLERNCTYFQKKFLMTIFNHLPKYFTSFNVRCPFLRSQNFWRLVLVVECEFELLTPFSVTFTFFAAPFRAVPPGASRPHHHPLGTPLNADCGPNFYIAKIQGGDIWTHALPSLRKTCVPFE